VPIITSVTWTVIMLIASFSYYGVCDLNTMCIHYLYIHTGPALGSLAYRTARHNANESALLYANESALLDANEQLECRSMAPNPLYWLVVVSLAYVLPLISSLIISICVFLIAQSSAKQRHASVTATSANRRAQVRVSLF
jgi:hypothetical protein